MAYREVDVIEVRELLRLDLAGVALKRIAKRLRTDVKTVRRYVRAGRRLGIQVPLSADGLTDEMVAAVIAEVGTMPGRARGETWARCVEHREVIEKLLARDVRLTKVRKLLLREHQLDVPYMTLWRYAIAELGFKARRTTVAVLEGEPGEEVQVDTGWLQLVVPDARGRRRRLRVWIFTPTRSRYRFVYPCFDETTASAIEACEAAWDFYGGIFRVLIPDNTKAMVEIPDPVSPKINDGFLEYSQSRNFEIDPTRRQRPTDKAKVERSVRVVRDDCFGGEVIETLERAREHAVWWCREDYGLKPHSRTRRRPREHFEAEERTALRPAPSSLYDIPIWAEPKVARDHYAQVARALYSLPTALIGKTLRARADSATVRFYDRGALVKTHPRLPPGGRSTDPNDFPEHQGALARRDVSFFRGLARKHGEHVEGFAAKILEGPAPWTRMRRVYLLVGLAKKYGSARLDAACATALAAEMHDVRRLERMLAAGAPAATTATIAPVIPITRGRYLRPAEDYALRRSQRADETKEE